MQSLPQKSSVPEAFEKSQDTNKYGKKREKSQEKILFLKSHSSVARLKSLEIRHTTLNILNTTKSYT